MEKYKYKNYSFLNRFFAQKWRPILNMGISWFSLYFFDYVIMCIKLKEYVIIRIKLNDYVIMCTKLNKEMWCIATYIYIIQIYAET